MYERERERERERGKDRERDRLARLHISNLTMNHNFIK